MNSFKVINHLVRLAQIAEEIEESSPDAANEIDGFLESWDSKNENPTPEVPQGGEQDVAYAPVNDLTPGPVGNSPGSVEDMAHEIAGEIMETEDFQEIRPYLESGEGLDVLDDLIAKVVKERLGAV